MPATFFENLLTTYRSNHPFVVYRKPQSQQLHLWLQRDDTGCFMENFKTPGFVFAPFDSSRKSLFLPLEKCDTWALDTGAFGLGSAAMLPVAIDEDEAKRQYHLDLVAGGVAAIRSGQFQKVVLSRRQEVLLGGGVAQPLYALSLFERLEAAYAAAFVYCYFHPKAGLWLGATPERLYAHSGQKLETMALAGTQEYTGTDPAPWGEKEQQEQQMVTDYIHRILEAQTVQSTVGQPKTVRSGPLWHIQTLLQAKLGVDELESLTRQLHPTPAVCGLPTQPARDFILKNEGYDRRFYTGYMGTVNTPDKEHTRSTELFVNLRCMELVDDKALLYVGGGITQDSNPESEWEETCAKAQTMLRAFRLET